MPEVTEAAPAPVPPAPPVPAPPVNAPGTGIEVPVAPPPGVEAGPPWIGIGVLALVVAFFAYAFLRSRARRRAEFAEERPGQPRLEQKERPEVPLQPRQVEPSRERPVVKRPPLEP